GRQIRNPLNLQKEHASDVRSICEFVSLQLRPSFQNRHASSSSLVVDRFLCLGLVDISKGLGLFGFFVFVYFAAIRAVQELCIAAIVSRAVDTTNRVKLCEDLLRWRGRVPRVVDGELQL